MTDASREVAPPPTSVSDLLDRLDRIDASLPKRLRQCAEFLRANANLIAISTVAEVSAAAGVAPSAFMRFCQALGFSGYSDMQALFRAEYAQIRPNYAERLADLRAKGGQDAGRLLADFVEAGHKTLTSMLNQSIVERIEQAIGILQEARIVHLCGMRRAFAITSYLSYMLQKMEIPSVLHVAAGGIDSTAVMRPGDVLFAATFAPFSPETLATARAARGAGVRVVLLTDSADCPARENADVIVIVREVDVEAFRVPTAALTVVTAIAVAFGGRREAVKNESVAQADEME